MIAGIGVGVDGFFKVFYSRGYVMAGSRINRFDPSVSNLVNPMGRLEINSLVSLSRMKFNGRSNRAFKDMLDVLGGLDERLAYRLAFYMDWWAELVDELALEARLFSPLYYYRGVAGLGLGVVFFDCDRASFDRYGFPVLVCSNRIVQDYGGFLYQLHSIFLRSPSICKAWRIASEEYGLEV